MKPGLLASVVLGLVVWGVSAQASEQAVQYLSGSETVSGLLVTPEGKGPFPGVVLIHEWWGLNDWVKEQARALALQGYAALAVDLYRGKATADKDEAHQLMMSVSQDRAVRDLKAAFAFLALHKSVDKRRIGSLGWCMGGRYSALLAVEQPTLAAAVVYYGALPTEPATIAKIKAALLGNFGGDDQGPAPAQVKAFEAAAKQAGKSVDFKIYDGAGHAFANVNNPWGGYREAAAQDAWTRTLAFLEKQLKTKR